MGGGRREGDGGRGGMLRDEALDDRGEDVGRGGSAGIGRHDHYPCESGPDGGDVPAQGGHDPGPRDERGAATAVGGSQPFALVRGFEYAKAFLPERRSAAGDRPCPAPPLCLAMPTMLTVAVSCPTLCRELSSRRRGLRQRPLLSPSAGEPLSQRAPCESPISSATSCRPSVPSSWPLAGLLPMLSRQCSVVAISWLAYPIAAHAGGSQPTPLPSGEPRPRPGPLAPLTPLLAKRLGFPSRAQLVFDKGVPPEGAIIHTARPEHVRDWRNGRGDKGGAWPGVPVSTSDGAEGSPPSNNPPAVGVVTTGGFSVLRGRGVGRGVVEAVAVRDALAASAVDEGSGGGGGGGERKGAALAQPPPSALVLVRSALGGDKGNWFRPAVVVVTE